MRCFAHGGDDGRIFGVLLELGATDLVEYHAVPEVGASKEAIRRIHELRVDAHVSDRDDLDWLCRAVDSPANGITLCCGSIAEEPANDVYAILDEFSRRGRIHFVHMRNIRYLEPGKSKDFYEAPHLSREGSLDVWRMCRALFVSPEAGILLLIYRLFQESFDGWMAVHEPQSSSPFSRSLISFASLSVSPSISFAISISERLSAQAFAAARRFPLPQAASLCLCALAGRYSICSLLSI